MKIADNHNPEFKYIIPIEVTGKNQLKIYAIWAMTAIKEKRKHRYIGQVFSAFNYYQLKDENTLILGDLNWNINFDHNSSGLHGKFSDFLNQMNYANLESAYHNYFAEEFGLESNATLYLHGKKEKPFHIDYIFGSRNVIRGLEKLQVGKWEDWRPISDHMPIYAEIKF